MVNVVITGSTKGIGKGYAREFLKRGHNVVVSGRTQQAVDEALAALGAYGQSGNAKVIGRTCNISQSDDNDALWQAAVSELGGVDIWINNAGYARTGPPLLGLKPAEIEAMVETNVIGTMKAAQTALRGMLEQGRGHMYNTLGGGADGTIVPGMIGYGTTKRAIHYFSRSLLKETKGTKIKISTISPGINITEGMIREIKELPKEKRKKMIRPVNLLGDHVETTTPWIVDRILANNKTGAHIQWMTKGKLMGRLLSAPFAKRNLFAKYGID